MSQQAGAHQDGLSPHARKTGGVYYTPDDIVAYMVEHSLGRLVAGKSPYEILALRIVDTSCGAGSFLIGAFGYLMQALLAIYRTDPDWAGTHRVETRDGELHLTMRHNGKSSANAFTASTSIRKPSRSRGCHWFAGSWRM